MKSSDEPGRISSLCAVLGRITASLDLETMLREVVEGVRALGLSEELGLCRTFRGARAASLRWKCAGRTETPPAESRPRREWSSRFQRYASLQST